MPFIFKLFFKGKFLGVILLALGVGIVLSLVLPLYILVIIEGIILACIGVFIFKCGL